MQQEFLTGSFRSAGINQEGMLYISEELRRLVPGCLLLIVMTLAVTTGVHARGTGTVGDTDIQVFKISGCVSTEAYAYTTSREANRRPCCRRTRAAETGRSSAEKWRSTLGASVMR